MLLLHDDPESLSINMSCPSASSTWLFVRLGLGLPSMSARLGAILRRAWRAGRYRPDGAVVLGPRRWRLAPVAFAFALPAGAFVEVRRRRERIQVRLAVATQAAARTADAHARRTMTRSARPPPPARRGDAEACGPQSAEQVAGWDAATIDEKLPMRDRMPAFVKALQTRIVHSLSSLDPSTSFVWDRWTRAAGGEGVSCVLQGGETFEKAGVNISVVHGHLPPPAVKQMRARMDEDQFAWWDGATALPFFACGLSLVVHPVNPKAPTVHLNYRYFEVDDPSRPSNTGPRTWWFGGGTDLTPSYLFPEDAVHFHRTMKEACDRYDPGYYPRFKRWCDDYFFLPHRGERRGIGGIFFDDLTGTAASASGASSAKDQEQLFAFVREAANAFLPAYMPIIEKRQWQRYSDHDKRWQQLRRGRYGACALTPLFPLQLSLAS